MQKNETNISNQPESREAHSKNEELDTLYNQENKNPQQRSQKKIESKEENTFKKHKNPKDRKRIKTPDFLKTIQRHTNFPAIYVLIAIVSCGLFVLFGSFEIFFTNLIGLVFPVYWTMHSFNGPHAQGEQKQWYTYWLIYLAMIPFDILFGRFLKYIPLFYFAKYVFLCWMFLPNTKGANYIHDFFIKKRFPDFDIVHKIDQSSENLKQKFHEFKGKVLSKFFKAQSQAQEADAQRDRIKNHEKRLMDKPADWRNSAEESRNIDEDIDKIDLKKEEKEHDLGKDIVKQKRKDIHESKDKLKNIKREEFSAENKNKKENVGEQKETSLKDILEEKDKGKTTEKKEHDEQEHLQTNESETDKSKEIEQSKDSNAYKNIVSNLTEKMKSGIEGNTKEKINTSMENLWDKMKVSDDQAENEPKAEADKNLTEKPFKESKEKGIEPENLFKGGKKMPQVDIEIANDENKENLRSENISKKNEKKKDANVAHVIEKDNEKRKDAGFTSEKKENQKIKQ